MNKTQLDWIVKRLEENGQVSRNDALKHFITRLGSRIYDLKQDGWEFEVERKGGDYIYVLVNDPRKKELTENEKYELYS